MVGGQSGDCEGEGRRDVLRPFKSGEKEFILTQGGVDGVKATSLSVMVHNYVSRCEYPIESVKYLAAFQSRDC